MSKYYLHIKDDKIVGKGQVMMLGNAINIEVSQDVYNNSEKYIYQNGEVVLDPDYEAKAQAKEAKRIGNLTMTSLDFITFLETLGLSLEAITAWLELPENLRIKTQLTYCQNVYCGVVTQLLPITLGDITITEDMVVNAFKAKYGEV